MDSVIFFSIDPDKLRALIAEAVSHALDTRAQVRETEQPSTPPNLLSRQDVAKRLRVSLPTLHAMSRRGTLRPVRVAGVRRVLYRSEDVEAALIGRVGR